MIGVAAKLYKIGAVSVEREEFQNTISQLIDLFPDSLSRKNPVYVQLRNGKSVWEFASQDKNCRLAIINDVRSCGVLINDYVNNGFTFAHKSFYDLLAAKYFMGKELRLHDETMEISAALSKVSAFSPKLKGDYVVRKLLAELVAAKIAMDMSGEDGRRISRKMFDQCARAFFPASLGIKLDKLLRSCKEGRAAESPHLLGRKKNGEVRRFQLIFLLAPFAILVYLVKLLQLNWQLGGEAAG